MNTYGLLGGLLIMASLGSWAVWERGDAMNWKDKYDSRVAQGLIAADAAKADAQKQEQADLANLKSQSSQAILQAQSGEQQAKNQLAIYLQKGNAASKGKVDLGHQCFSVQVPSELLPWSK